MMTLNLKRSLNPQARTLSILTSGSMMMLIKKIVIRNFHPSLAREKVAINTFKMMLKMKKNVRWLNKRKEIKRKSHSAMLKSSATEMLNIKGSKKRKSKSNLKRTIM